MSAEVELPQGWSIELDGAVEFDLDTWMVQFEQGSALIFHVASYGRVTTRQRHVGPLPRIWEGASVPTQDDMALSLTSRIVTNLELQWMDISLGNCLGPRVHDITGDTLHSGGDDDAIFKLQRAWGLTSFRENPMWLPLKPCTVRAMQHCAT